MSDTSPRPEGYEGMKCELKLSGCEMEKPEKDRLGAGYLRRPQYAQTGPWLNACESCARKPYEQPAQFQEVSNG